LELFAGNAGSVSDLTTWRLNPDTKSVVRDDIEFFIPQLCGYLIDEKKPQELRDGLFEILVQAANANFYFSHRLFFFLQAYTGDTQLSEETLRV